MRGILSAAVLVGLCAIGFVTVRFFTDTQATEVPEAALPHDSKIAAPLAAASDLSTKPARSAGLIDEAPISSVREIEQAPPVVQPDPPDYWTERKKMLDRNLKKFHELKRRDPRGVTEHILLTASIATLFDAQGMYRDTSITEAPSPGEAGAANRFIANSRAYWFERGLYPEYDAANDYYLLMNDYQEARSRGRTDMSEPAFDPKFFDLYDERAQEALRITGTHLK